MKTLSEPYDFNDYEAAVCYVGMGTVAAALAIRYLIYPMPLVMLLILGVALWLVISLIVVLKMRAASAKVQKAVDAQERKEEKQKEIFLAKTLDGCILKYMYKDVKGDLRADRAPEDLIGKEVAFAQTESDAVALRLNKRKIGSLLNPTVASVAREWLKTGEPYRAFVLDVDGKKLTIGAAFYRDMLSRCLRAEPDAPEYRVLGTRGEEAQFRLIGIEVGLRLDLDIEPESGKLALYEGENLIGYLPASAAKRIEAESGEDSQVYVSDVSDEDGQIKLHVRVFKP